MATVARMRLFSTASSFSTAAVSSPLPPSLARTPLTNMSTAAVVVSASPKIMSRTLPRTHASNSSARICVLRQTAKPLARKPPSA